MENIEKKFADFETIMENNDYTEIISIVKVLDEMIAHISTVIEEVPDLLLLTEKIIPERIKEVNKGSVPFKFLSPEEISPIQAPARQVITRVRGRASRSGSLVN